MSKIAALLALGYLLIALIIVGPVCAAGNASSYVPPAKLSVADAVAAALGENSDLKQAEENRLSAQSRLRIAAFNTTFGAGASVETKSTVSSTNSPEPPGGGTVSKARSTTNSAKVTSSLTYQGLGGTEATVNLSPFGVGGFDSSLELKLQTPLMRGRGRLSGKSNLLLGARSDASVQEKQLYLTRQTTIVGVIRAYYQAVLEREKVKVQEKAVTIAQEVADGTRKRADAGLVAEIEVSRADLRVASVKDALNLQNQASRAAADQLMLAIGAGVGHDSELTDGVPSGHADAPTLVDAMKTALVNRYELGISDEQLSEKARELAIAGDKLRPELNAVAGFSSSSDGLEAGLGQGDTSVGLEMVFPIDKRIDKEQRDTTSRELDVLRRVRTFTMEQIAQQVRQAYWSLDAARASLDILSQNSKVAEQSLSLAQRMVDEGLVSNRETLDAQDALTGVESGLLSAKTNVFLADINLKYAMGEDLTTVVSK